MIWMSVAFLWVALSVQDASEAEAKAALEAFRAVAGKRGASDEAVEDALRRLSETRHPLVLKELALWAKRPHRPVRKVVRSGGVVEESGVKLNLAAAECLADGFEGDREAAQALLDAARARDRDRVRKDSIEEEDQVGDVAAFLECFSRVRCRPLAARLVPYFRHRSDVVCAAALEASGKIGSKESIEPLILLLAEAEKMRDAGDLELPDAGGGAGFGSSRKDILLEGAREGLEKITGKKFEGSRAWADWWRANRKSFREIK